MEFLLLHGMVSEHPAVPRGQRVLAELRLCQHVLELHFCLNKCEPFLEDVVELSQEGMALVHLTKKSRSKAIAGSRVCATSFQLK